MRVASCVTSLLNLESGRVCSSDLCLSLLPWGDETNGTYAQDLEILVSQNRVHVASVIIGKQISGRDRLTVERCAVGYQDGR